MGCGSSSQSSMYADPEAAARSASISRELEKERAQRRNELKILVLGTGESGKSTVLKQMHLIHKGPFPDEERLSYKEIVYSNTVQSMQAIVMALPLLGLQVSEANQEAAYFIEDLDPHEAGLEDDALRALTVLIPDPAVQSAIEQAAQFQLNNSATYFFAAIERTLRKDYVPTDQDIVMARVRTTGIMEHTFVIDKTVWKLFDVGGQRSERRKWISCFENVNVVLFLIALSEYDELLREDETIGRLEESATLFTSITNSAWFTNSSIVLFLNKTDLFQKKLKVAPFQNYFADYRGPSEFEPAADYLKQSFSSMYNPQEKHKVLYVHFTNATDTRGVAQVMSFVQDNLARSMLADAHII